MIDVMIYFALAFYGCYLIYLHQRIISLREQDAKTLKIMVNLDNIVTGRLKNHWDRMDIHSDKLSDLVSLLTGENIPTLQELEHDRITAAIRNNGMDSTKSVNDTNSRAGH